MDINNYDGTDLELEEIAAQVEQLYDDNKAFNVTLYVAHTRYEKPIRQLARQTGRPESDIQSRVEYVRAQLFEELQEQFNL